MKRRDFGKVLSGSALGTVAVYGEPVKAKPQKNLMMHLCSEHGSALDEKNNTFLERMGVKYKIDAPTTVPGKGWDLDEVLRMKELCAKHNITLDILKLASQPVNVDGGQITNYMMGNYEKGDREIDIACDMIRTTAQAGIRCIEIVLREMENQRNRAESKIGRGGNRYSTWDLKKAENIPRFDKPVTAEQNWERVTHFLERVIPVATEYKVQIANHPCDPWLPPGFRGVDRVLGGFEGFKRYIDICPSPYHGLAFCLGCMAESCDDPANEVYEIVQYFAERKKIFHVHYRNIIGGRNNFYEVFPDEGVVNMHRVMQILRDTQYPYTIDPDHCPSHDDDPGSYQGWAFQFGYIQAMIQAVNDEV